MLLLLLRLLDNDIGNLFPQKCNLQLAYWRCSVLKINFWRDFLLFSQPTYYLLEKRKIMDEITKKKISYKLKGKKKQARTKLLIGQAMSGKQKTQEHKDAISLGMTDYWKKRKNNN